MEEKCIPVEVVYEKKGSFSSYLKGLVFGGLIGAGVALLAAPHTGEHTRSMLRDKGNEIKDKAAITAEQARRKAEELARTGNDRVNELKDKGQSILNDQKVTLNSAVEGVKEGVRTYRELNTQDMEKGETAIGRPFTTTPDSDITTTTGL